MKSFKLTKKIVAIMLLFLFFFAIGETFARAGGGGGSRGGGSRSSSSRSSSSYGGSSSSYSGGGEVSPVVVFIFIIIIIVIAVASEKAKQNGGGYYENSLDFDDDDQLLPIPQRKGIDAFKKDNPDFNENQFINNVNTAFLAIQDAWSKKNLKDVRRYISDGVWQRFHTQFTMMDQLEQTNKLSHIKINDSFIDVCEQDGQFDVMHVAISASLVDYFECAIDRSMNSGGPESFVEYWSFIRKRGIEQKDLYNSTACPSCGAEITEDLGEIAQCPYCSTLLNSGEYDWVLAEITQAADYKNGVFGKAKNLSVKRDQLVADNNDFSVQHIEDHVSNGYLQYMGAKVMNKPEMVSRFFTKELFDAKSNEISSFNYLFNRLYLNEVTLIAAEVVDGFNRLYVSITETSQLVQKQGGRLVHVGSTMSSSRMIVRLIRKVEAGEKKGSLYMHQCATCGAQVTDSLDTTCPYCGTMMNSGENEWVFDAIMNPTDYRNYCNENSSRFDFAVKVEQLDAIMTTKEYAINNIMCIIAADGKMSIEELQFLEEFATKMKFNKKAKSGIIAAAKQNRLRLAFPEEQKAKEKIYELMVEAAKADGVIQPQEQMILDHVKSSVYKDDSLSLEI